MSSVPLQSCSRSTLDALDLDSNLLDSVEYINICWMVLLTADTQRPVLVRLIALYILPAGIS